MGEESSSGLYLFVNNDVVNNIDVLGLYPLWDWGQFLRWLENTSDEAERVDWNYFDPYGSASHMLVDSWMEYNNDALCNACKNAEVGDSWIAGLPGGSKSVENQRHVSLEHPWINEYLAHARIAAGGIGISKDSKTCECEFEFGLDLEATDTGDFNDTDQKFFFGLISDRFMKNIIHDRLKIGGDYHMYGLSYESVYRGADCE